MIIEQLMPAKSPTMTEGTIAAWRVKPGDQVKSGQVMAEIQTDKAVIEWECSDPGFVAEILIPAGEVAQVNMVAAIFTTKAGEDAKAAIAKAKATNAAMASAGGGAAPAASQPVAVSVPPVIAAVTATAKVSPQPSPPAALPKGVRVSPVAAKVAATAGIDLRALKGSGPDGRIVRRDVEAAATNGVARIGSAPAKPEKPKLRVTRPDGAAAVDQPMTPMRTAIGKRLLAAKTGIPHFQITERIDVGALVALREQLNAIEGFKVSFNDLVVRATALALRQHPRLNATMNGNVIRNHDSADISIAVAIPDGLITPIVFKAHTLSLRQIGEQVKALAKKAADGKLQPAEFEGGTFTISNLGMYGIEQFNAIINPPQAAILAVGGIKDEPVVRGGEVVAGKTMRLTLSADHRVVDGAAGAEFMQTLRGLLETPVALLV